MAAITQKAYESLRSYIVSDWTNIQLKDDLGNTVVTYSVLDDNVSWTHAKGSTEDNPVLELSVSVRGDQVTSLPVTFAQSVVTNSLNEEMSAEPLSTPFTMENQGDLLTVRHKIEVPQVV